MDKAGKPSTCGPNFGTQTTQQLQCILWDYMQDALKRHLKTHAVVAEQGTAQQSSDLSTPESHASSGGTAVASPSHPKQTTSK
eukprot:2858043-Amphidinium_carterae.2